jgi:Holliday junction resolvase RusA-like endonuclease
VSHQAKDKKHKQEWMDCVYGRARQVWKGTPVSSETLRFTLVYLCEEYPPDINNIIKPVQDALIGLVYSDEKLVIDVQGHLRMANDLIEITGLPPLLQEVIINGVDCLYIRICSSSTLGDLL